MFDEEEEKEVEANGRLFVQTEFVSVARDGICESCALNQEHDLL
jgi:hypothetical protein